MAEMVSMPTGLSSYGSTALSWKMSLLRLYRYLYER